MFPQTYTPIGISTGTNIFAGFMIVIIDFTDNHATMSVAIGCA